MSDWKGGGGTKVAEGKNYLKEEASEVFLLEPDSYDSKDVRDCQCS